MLSHSIEYEVGLEKAVKLESVIGMAQTWNKSYIANETYFKCIFKTQNDAANLALEDLLDRFPFLKGLFTYEQIMRDGCYDISYCQKSATAGTTQKRLRVYVRRVIVIHDLIEQTGEIDL